MAIRQCEEQEQVSCNFFGCAGYDIIDNNGFCSVDEGIEAAVKINPDIIVICSSDEEYATYATEIINNIKAFNPKTIVIIAGNPTLEGASSPLPVDDIINIKTNLKESLTKYQNLLKVTQI